MEVKDTERSERSEKDSSHSFFENKTQRKKQILSKIYTDFVK